MSIPIRSLRGSGPAPAGYYACHHGAKCPAWRNPTTGRFGSPHFHQFYTCGVCGAKRAHGYMAREDCCIACDMASRAVSVAELMAEDKG